MIMKKVFYSLTVLVSFGLLACGRPSTSNYFALDGVGDPNAPIVGNPLPGKWGGTVTLANWDLLQPTYSEGVFGVSIDSSLQINQAYLNNKDIAGLGGWDLIVLAIPQPRRLGPNDNALCYMDPEALPLLGGSLVSADVGEDIELEFGAETFRSRRDDDEDVASDDLLIWFSDIQNLQTGEFLLNPYGADVEMAWDGGTLDGFDRAPPLAETEVVRFPQDIVLTDGVTTTMPTVNNVPISSDLVATDTEYEVEWTEESGAGTDLMGTEIVLTVYGPANLGTTSQYDVAPDNPYFNRIARMVCLVRDEAEEFTIFQSVVDEAMVAAGEASPFTVDELMDVALKSGKYEFSTEDVNGNGKLDPAYNCGSPLAPSTCVEDGNDNGVIDNHYGIALTINRRTERDNFINMGGGRTSRILVTGNALKQTKMEVFSAIGQCGNGLDDDLDGDIDNADSACTDEYDSETPQCSNGKDDDGDLQNDFPDDLQCTSDEDDDESA